VSFIVTLRWALSISGVSDIANSIILLVAFLEKIGWEDENNGNGAQKKPTSRNGYNEKKDREKAQRREKARIEKLEVEILKSENALEKYNAQLVIEANRNNLAPINDLSKKISQVKQEIEDLYGQYAG
jgi:hypothetical protein